MTGNPKTLLTPRFVEALQYAITAHHSQVRKGTDVTYVAHLLGVASLVLEHGGDEDEAIAGLLHDTIEDCANGHAATIRARFGAAVADLVLGLTDGTAERKAAFASPQDKRADWKRRKDAYLAQLAHHDDRVLRVSCCDKLYNARAIVSDLHAIGFDVFRRFTAGVDGTLWYYAELAKVFERRQVGPAAELIRTVREMARLAEGAAR
jgi:(p)ppGpp synthase/HD superfamily hydrolase